MMRPTIKDVAARSGVSTATVSMVLNEVESARVGQHTRDRVRQAAAELGYRPNSIARGLRTQRTSTIGLLSDRVTTTPYASRMLLGAQEEAWAADYVLMLLNTDGDPRLEEKAVRVLADRQVDGFVYATMYHRRARLPKMLRGLPTVVLNSFPTAEGIPYVVPDEERGGYDAAAILLRRGHRRVAYLRNSDPVVASGLREVGYRRAHADAGVRVDPTLVVEAEALSRGGYAAGTALLSRPDRPTAIFVFNDLMAIGVYRAARQLGLCIPRDLSVVGYDDQQLVAAELDPGLTTVALPHQAMGQWAARRLVELIESPDPDGHGVAEPGWLEPCRVVERGSVGPPPAADR